MKPTQIVIEDWDGDGGIRLPDEVLQAMREQSNLVLEALAAENDLNGRIWASQKAFLEEANAMQALTEKELYNWR